MEWSIQELARAAGTTSRTLRHYGDVGLLEPSRIGRNGLRHYDEAALVRLQRILLLRGLGLGVPAVARVLAGGEDVADALRLHLELLHEERGRIDRLIASVRTTIDKLERGEQLMPTEVLDGFDHRRHEDEVVERWGRDAWSRSARWWEGLDEEGRERHRRTHERIARDYAAALQAGHAAGSDEAQAIARRHVDWLAAAAEPTKGYLVGLGELYVSDPRFRQTYDAHGAGTAAFVRDALAAYAERRF